MIANYMHYISSCGIDFLKYLHVTACLNTSDLITSHLLVHLWKFVLLYISSYCCLLFVVKTSHFMQITSQPRKLFGEFLYLNNMKARKS